MSKANDDIVIYGVGDIGPNRPDPGSIFKHVRDVIKNGDISFCHLEVLLSNRGEGPHSKDVCFDPIIAAEMKKAGFDIVGAASNHNLAAGTDAFLDTITHLKNQELAVIGVLASSMLLRSIRFSVSSSVISRLSRVVKSCWHRSL